MNIINTWGRYGNYTQNIFKWLPESSLPDRIGQNDTPDLNYKEA